MNIKHSDLITKKYIFSHVVTQKFATSIDYK